jgi:hypothetical protein
VVICFCLFNKWWCDVCSQVKPQFELHQFLGQSGYMPYAEYGAWNTETVGTCALALAHGTFPRTYFEDVSQLQSETVNSVLFVWVLYFDSLELFLVLWRLNWGCIKIYFCVTENSSTECYLL